MRLHYKNELLENVKAIREDREWTSRGSKVVIKANDYCGGNDCMFLMQYSNFTNKVKSITTTPKDKDRLYFDGSSKYPRYKLQYSTFKRCIKVETADCVVWDDDYFKNLDYRAVRSYNATYNYIVIKDKDKKDDTTIYYFTAARDLNLPDSTPTDTIFRKVASESILSEDAQIIYEGKAFFTTNRTETDFVFNVLEDVYPALITNKELDKLVNGNCEKLDEETLISIQDMLASTDGSVVEMGLKLLTNYDVNEYMYTIYTLMRLYENNIKSNKSWNSTGIKQLRNTLNYVVTWNTNFPNCILNDMQQFEKIKIKKQDAELAHKIIVRETANYLNKQIKTLQDQLTKYNIQISAPTVC